MCAFTTGSLDLGGLNGGLRSYIPAWHHQQDLDLLGVHLEELSKAVYPVWPEGSVQCTLYLSSFPVFDFSGDDAVKGKRHSCRVQLASILCCTSVLSVMPIFTIPGIAGLLNT